MSFAFNMLRHPRMRTNLLLVCVCTLGLYMLLLEKGTAHIDPRHQRREILYAEDNSDLAEFAVDPQKAEEYIVNSHKVEHVEYHSPFKV